MGTQAELCLDAGSRRGPCGCSVGWRAAIAKLRRAETEGRETAYLDAWEVLLGGPDDQLVETMTSTGEWACALRQTSPFAGVLGDEERRAVIQRVHQELHAAGTRPPLSA